MCARVLVLAGASRSLVNYRRPLLQEMVRRGHEVIAAAPDDPAARNVRSILDRDGVRLERIFVRRRGVNPLDDLATIRSITSLIRRTCPERILAYHSKPLVYGGLAARWAGNVPFYPMFTGLGYAFAENGGLRQRAVRRVVRTLYRNGLKSARCIIFQNQEDRKLFDSLGLIPDQAEVVRVFGSGVDLKRYRPLALPAEPTFVMLSRLLLAKGIGEYVEAARIVKKTHPSARFLLAGSPEPGSDGVEESQLRQWETRGLIEYLGHVEDVRPVLARSRFVVLPSYYREGVPLSLLEGLATGRPLITTDSVGCRDTIDHGRNGLVVPPRDSCALADAMISLIDASEERVSRMAEASLELARRRFDVQVVNADILEAMDL